MPSWSTTRSMRRSCRIIRTLTRRTRERRRRTSWRRQLWPLDSTHSTQWIISLMFRAIASRQRRLLSSSNSITISRTRCRIPIIRATIRDRCRIWVSWETKTRWVWIVSWTRKSAIERRRTKMEQLVSPMMKCVVCQLRICANTFRMEIFKTRMEERIQEEWRWVPSSSNSIYRLIRMIWLRISISSSKGKSSRRVKSLTVKKWWI